MPQRRGGLPVRGSLHQSAVLLDTGALLALANRQDGHHSSATDCLSEIAKRRLPVFVTLPTIYESHRRFLFDLGARRAQEFLERIYDGSTNVVRTVERDEVDARRLIERYSGLTLTDAANMAVMERLEIAVCFGFDRHFLQAGFIRIPPFHL